MQALTKQILLLGILGVYSMVAAIVIPEPQMKNQLVFLEKGPKVPSNVETTFSGASPLVDEIKSSLFKFEEKIEEKLEKLEGELEFYFKNLKATRSSSPEKYEAKNDLDDAFEEAFSYRKGHVVVDADRSRLITNNWHRFDGEAWVKSAVANVGNMPEEMEEELQEERGSNDHSHHGCNGDHRDHHHDGNNEDHDSHHGYHEGGHGYHRQPHGDHGHSGFAPHRPYHDIPKPPRDGRKHEDKTLWDLVNDSKYTNIFSKLAEKDVEFMNLLKDPNGNTTLFAPTDNAFKKLLPHGIPDEKEIPKGVLKRMLYYHTAPGTHASYDMVHHNTLMSKLEENDLGEGMHQRLRLGLDQVHGPSVNFYADLIMVDIFAKNGVIHGINNVLLPPPSIEDIVQLLPGEFSTTVAAFYKTGLIEELGKIKGKGLTLFAPSNEDWKKLGPLINAYLFSTHGEECLRGLLKYHVVAGKTLYSDALVEPGRKRTGFEPENSMDDPSGLDHGYSHLYLDTLLGDKKLSVDINRYERFLSFRVNGLNLVIISDGIAKDGVIQVPDHVLIPPHMHDRNPNYDKMGLLGKERMTLEDLRERMQPYIDVEKEEKLEL